MTSREKFLVIETRNHACTMNAMRALQNPITLKTIDDDETRYFYKNNVATMVLKKVPYKKKDEGNLLDYETKKFRREDIETTVQELLSKFQEEAMTFKKHFFNNNHQQKVFRESKENIKDDEAVIICDFSEIYQCRHHIEIQGKHFNASRNQITLHTGVIYIHK